MIAVFRPEQRRCPKGAWRAALGSLAGLPCRQASASRRPMAAPRRGRPAACRSATSSAAPAWSARAAPARRDDPIILLEEITGAGPAVLVVRNARTGHLDVSPALGFLTLSVVKIIANRGPWAWTGFDLELRTHPRPAEPLYRRPLVRPAADLRQGREGRSVRADAAGRRALRSHPLRWRQRRSARSTFASTSTSSTSTGRRCSIWCSGRSSCLPGTTEPRAPRRLSSLGEMSRVE